ncbi:MAG: helix-turn-helix transcriptional regulator, partial [Erysipelotrichaceae bacterium]
YQQLKEYYYDLPLLKDPLWFLNLMQQWAKHALGENVKTQHVKHTEMEALNLHYLVPEDPIVSMRILEERYAAEQDLFLAVQYGNYQKMYELLESGMIHRFAKRVDDPLLEARHRLIVFNTLMRRAVYQGGVHPLHIDRLSNHLAICINTLEDPQQADGLMKQIVTSYFSLVKEHSLAQYSKPVQTMLATIDASLVADLRLQRFSESLFMNASYLSTLFKKEVGKTLTDYVNDKRLQFSKTLLTTTTLSMQEIAIGCGVKDLHYYTRLFKQYEGCTPSQYRKLHTKAKKIRISPYFFSSVIPRTSSK